MKKTLNILKKNRLMIASFLIFLAIGLILSSNNDKGFFVIYFSKIRTESLDDFFALITKLGEHYPFIFLFFYFIYKKSRASFAIIATGITMPLFSQLLKNYFKHPRPKTYFKNNFDYFPIQEIENVSFHTGHNSFPSGHTFSAFAIFILLAFITKKNSCKILFLTLSILVAISRIYLGQHFLEDVIFGASIGFLHALLIYILFWITLKDKNILDINFKHKLS